MTFGNARLYVGCLTHSPKQAKGNTMAVESENHGAPAGKRWRIVAWSSAVLLLMVPLVAMQFTAEVDWTLGDFVFAGILIFGTLGAFDLVTRVSSSTTYRLAAGLALLGGFLLLWINGAVGIPDGPADVMYLGVIAGGIGGALLARLRPQGMASTLFAVALAMAVVGALALAADVVPEHNSAFKVIGITSFFMVLFVGSALLFRQAAHEGRGRDGE